MSVDKRKRDRALEPVGRVGIVGMGDFGVFCVGAYKDAADLRVVAVADPRPDLRERATSLGIESVCSDWRELLSIPAIEVVHIVTPPASHAEIAMAAAVAGKSVFIEKPVALSMESADEIISALKHNNRAFGINYVMRHQPAYKLLIDLAERGLLGAIRRISLNNGAQAVAPGHWFWDRELSGGILVEHGVHFFDVFGQIAGEAASTATTDEGTRVVAELAYGSGGWGSFYHDFSLDLRVERLDASIIFETGTAHITGWIPESLEVRAVTTERADEWREVASRYPQISTRFIEDTVSISCRAADRRQAYLRATALGMRQTVMAHRDPSFMPTVSAADARSSLAVALAATAISHAPTSPPRQR